MFCDRVLATRIDAAEAALCAAVARNAPDASILPLGGGLAVLSRAGSPVNKVAGAGFTGTLDEAELEHVEAAWRAREQAVRFELATLADPAVHRQLTTRGYCLEGFEHVLGRPITAADADAKLAPHVTIERMTAATASIWLELSLEGFGAGDGTGAEADDGFAAEVLRQVFTEFAQVEELRGYIARVDGEPAGAASMRLDGGPAERQRGCLRERATPPIAQLAGASTIPRFRRRGVQRSLLTARLAAAAAEGAGLAIVTTAPGSQSQANVGTLGFELLYARAVLVR